jgi:hypothetical protein
MISPARRPNRATSTGAISPLSSKRVDTARLTSTSVGSAIAVSCLCVVALSAKGNTNGFPPRSYVSLTDSDRGWFQPAGHFRLFALRTGHGDGPEIDDFALLGR